MVATIGRVIAIIGKPVAMIGRLVAIIAKVYLDASNSAHPVSIANERQKTVPEVRIIDELDE